MVDRYFVDSYGIEDIDDNGTWVKYEDHEQALAEKNMSEDLTTYENSDGHWVSEQEHRRIVAEKDLAYRQLMAQAVDLAKTVLQGYMQPSHLPSHRLKTLRIVRATKFLNSDEAQAFLKEHQ